MGYQIWWFETALGKEIFKYGNELRIMMVYYWLDLWQRKRNFRKSSTCWLCSFLSSFKSLSGEPTAKFVCYSLLYLFFNYFIQFSFPLLYLFWCFTPYICKKFMNTSWTDPPNDMTLLYFSVKEKYMTIGLWLGVCSDDEARFWVENIGENRIFFKDFFLLKNDKLIIIISILLI